MRAIQLSVSLKTKYFYKSFLLFLYILIIYVLVRREHWILLVVHFHSSTVYYCDSLDGELGDFALRAPLNT